jgi:dTMP kinase
MLVEALKQKGMPVEAMRFPDRTTTIGTMIGSYLQSTTEMDDRAVHLLFASNRWEAQSRIRELLLSGTTIVCDRYSFSGIAYTSAKGFDLGWCAQPETGLPKPDLVLYLEVPTEVAEARGEYGEERYEKREFQVGASDMMRHGFAPPHTPPSVCTRSRACIPHRTVDLGFPSGPVCTARRWQAKVRGAFTSLREQFPDWEVIDAQKEPAEIHAGVWAKAEQAIANGVHMPSAALPPPPRLVRPCTFPLSLPRSRLLHHPSLEACITRMWRPVTDANVACARACRGRPRSQRGPIPSRS